MTLFASASVPDRGVRVGHVRDQEQVQQQVASTSFELVFEGADFLVERRGLVLQRLPLFGRLAGELLLMSFFLARSRSVLHEFPPWRRRRPRDRRERRRRPGCGSSLSPVDIVANEAASSIVDLSWSGHQIGFCPSMRRIMAICPAVNLSWQRSVAQAGRIASESIYEA